MTRKSAATLKTIRVDLKDPYVHTRYSRSRNVWQVVRSPNPLWAPEMIPYRTADRILSSDANEERALFLALMHIEDNNVCIW